MKMPLGTEVYLSPGHIVLAGDPAPPAAKGVQQPPLFGPCLLWLRSPISATAELLFKNRYRASTSTRLHFDFWLCCPCNETRAPNANPPSIAQLQGTPYHSPSYILVRAAVWASGEDRRKQRQTDRHTDRQTNRRA